MVELTIGEKRLEYLDTANKAMASGDVASAGNYIEAFLTTVRDGTPIAEELEKGFDDTEKKKELGWEKVVKETQKEEQFIQSERRYNGRGALELIALKERLNICWQISIKHGMFND